MSLACVICSKPADRNDLVCPRDHASWWSLFNAAEIRGFRPILELSGAAENAPEVFYHRDCRFLFTHKKALDCLKCEHRETTENEVTESGKQRSSQRKTKTNDSRVYEKICIFCEKSNKYIKNSRTRETLVQANELRADKKVRAVATARMDEKILAITSRELVAAEAHYHRTCYRDYTRAYYSKSSKEVVDDDDQSYSKIESDAFQMLFDSIRSDLFTSPRIVPMMDLTAQLVDFMKDQGVEEVWGGTKKHMTQVRG